MQTCSLVGGLHDLMRESLLPVTVGHFKVISFPPLACAHRSTLGQPLIVNYNLNGRN